MWAFVHRATLETMGETSTPAVDAQILAETPDRAGAFPERLLDGASSCVGRLLQKAARMSVGVQQDFDSLPKRGIAGTHLFKEGGSLAGRLLQGAVKECLFVHLRSPGCAEAASTLTSVKRAGKAPSII